MEEQIKELEILKEAIQKMQEVKECLVCLDSVTNEEYEKYCAFIYDLDERKNNLENKVSSYKIEEV